MIRALSCIPGLPLFPSPTTPCRAFQHSQWHSPRVLLSSRCDDLPFSGQRGNELRKSISMGPEGMFRVIGCPTPVLDARPWVHGLFRDMFFFMYMLYAESPKVWSPWKGPFLPRCKDDRRCRTFYHLLCILPWSMRVCLYRFVPTCQVLPVLLRKYFFIHLLSPSHSIV